MSTTARPAAAHGGPHLHWSLVVPVKVLARAKTRMAAAAGPHREALARAVAADTVAAALRCDRVRDVIVVTDDPLPAADLAALGARVVPDVPDAGLNPALVYGAGRGREASPDAGVGALSADLPALRPDELARVLDAAAAVPEAFVPDAAGVGTTLRARVRRRVPRGAPRPRRGGDPPARHRQRTPRRRHPGRPPRRPRARRRPPHRRGRGPAAVVGLEFRSCRGR